MPQSRPYKVFLASPGDVDELRISTIKIFNKEFNEHAVNRRGNVIFHCYAWEVSKTPAYTDDYQSEIFGEFGDWCDIFICLFWYKYGAGTDAEYTKAVEYFRKKNPLMKMWMCRYHRAIAPAKITDPASLAQLNTFIENQEKYWAPLGGKRGAIDSRQKYETAIRQEINEFLETEKKRTPSSPAYSFLSGLK